MTRSQARVVLVGVAVAVVLGGYLGRRPMVVGNVKPGEFCDTTLHAMIVAETQAGRSYYDVCGPLLLKHGYAVRPFVHWRLPTLNYLAVALKRPLVAKIVLFLLGSARPMGLGHTGASHGRPPHDSYSCRWVGLPAALSLLGNWYLQHELWAGILIALSLGLYPRSVAASVVCGLAALAIRELALPYVILMMALAFVEKRRQEAMIWLAGIAGFAFYLAWHAHLVSIHMIEGPADPSWLRFPGWPHVVACSSWMFFALPPYWLAGGLAVLGIIGVATARDLRLALTVTGYMLAVAIAGKPFNDYWGLVFTPLLAVGLVYAMPWVAQVLAARGDAWRRPPLPGKQSRGFRCELRSRLLVLLFH